MMWPITMGDLRTGSPREIARRAADKIKLLQNATMAITVDKCGRVQLEPLETCIASQLLSCYAKDTDERELAKQIHEDLQWYKEQHTRSRSTPS